MPLIHLPYGRGAVTGRLPDRWPVTFIKPPPSEPLPDPAQAVGRALDNPVGGRSLAEFAGARSAAIAINDKTRPTPLDRLLPPLLQRLEALGLPPSAITLIIATGNHAPMTPDQFAQVVPAAILRRYPVICHDAGDEANLAYLGRTGRGVPVWINRRFVEAELRLVVGNIEPHQFMGFSGGVKSAAIGLAGKATIDHNHAMLTHADARLGRFHDNPMRQDVEEIGRLIGVHLALNSILNEAKQLVGVVAGEPYAVMEQGIPLARAVYEAPVAAPFDLLIISPGGHPKDINLYQAQKALGHAAPIGRPGGAIILAAACPEGPGSAAYEEWMTGMTSHQAVLERFSREKFRIGPHKAFQLARDSLGRRVLLLSAMPAARVQRLLLTPVASLEEALALALPHLAADAQIGVMPWANATIPVNSFRETGEFPGN